MIYLLSYAYNVPIRIPELSHITYNRFIDLDTSMTISLLYISSIALLISVFPMV